MPLNKAGLESDLESLFSDPPDTTPACAQAWADAVKAYASAIVPTSTTVTAAAATLAGSLLTAFQSPNAIAPMEAAFLAFGATVGGGMAPAFVATPPAGAVGFADQVAAPHPETHAAAAAAWASRIDTWMRTGTATPSGGGSPINWS